MKKLVLLFIFAMMVLTSCNNKLTPEQAEAAVLQGETEKLPLLLQTIPFVDNITIDSIHLTIRTEPMRGFLYTTWVSDYKKQPIIVQIDSIRMDKTRKDYIQWQTDWPTAAKSYIIKSLRY